MSGPSILRSLLDFRRLDQLALGDSPVHRIDARAKVLVTLVFIVCVMSFGRYEIARLLPFLALPVLVGIAARVPSGVIVRQAWPVLPVALLIGLPNPLFDRDALVSVGGYAVSGGWVSMASIVLRAMLAALSSVVLVSVTGFPAICEALERLGMPSPLAVQLLFLYRYLGVLGEEARRMSVAYAQRSCGRGPPLGHFGMLTGRLLLRTWDRAERIHLAMCARGFAGEFVARPGARLGADGWLFVVAGCTLLVLLRTQELVHWLGSLALGLAT